MQLKNILDSIYVIPVILDHMDNPRTITKEVLQSMGINEEDIEALRSIKSLLQYHKHIISSDFKPDYPLLRKGLTEYFDRNLKYMFKNSYMTDLNMYVLDYGCGSGQVSKQFLEDNPGSSVMLVDKYESPGLPIVKIDFEADQNWYQKLHLQKTFDMVILSEVLHCKSPIFQDYLIRSSLNMLKPHGKLFIVENIDPCMAYRISKLKQGEYKALHPEDIESLVSEHNTRRLTITSLQRHIIYIYEKI